MTTLIIALVIVAFVVYGVVYLMILFDAYSDYTFAQNRGSHSAHGQISEYSAREMQRAAEKMRLAHLWPFTWLSNVRQAMSYRGRDETPPRG